MIEVRMQGVVETPATGVMKTGSFGDAMFYYVRCDCGDDCAHNIEVEANDAHIQVHIHHVQHTKWWEKNRWLQLWQIVTKGHAEMQTTLILDEQTALNYSSMLKSAVQDVKEFKDALKKKNTND